MVPIVGMIVLFCLPSGERVNAEVARENPSNGFDLLLDLEHAEQVPELNPIRVAENRALVTGITRGEGAKHWSFGERFTPDFLEQQEAKAKAAAKAAEAKATEAAAAKAPAEVQPPTA
jgi:hypothetical protein